MRLSECERKYLTRESKPEDLEAIKELTALLQQQKQKIKDLTVSANFTVELLIPALYPNDWLCPL